jgi:glycosyltransferase involved in cell wall biosynthesis
MRILCLIDSAVKPEDQWLWDYLPSHDDEIDFLWITTSDRYPKWGKLIAYYPMYMLLGIKALIQAARKEYDLIVAWEGKNGFPLALMRSVLGHRNPKMVILTYIHRGVISHFPALARFAFRSVDQITVTSRQEISSYNKILDIPKKKISFCPLGWYDSGNVAAELSTTGSRDFILASGRSYRDYATFIAALRGLECKVVINARRFNLQGIDIPTNVMVNDLLPLHQFWKQLARCLFVVVPLKEVPHAAGDGHIVQAMAAGKAVIATRAPSTETYIEEGETGLLVPPHNINRLQEAINYLLEYPDETKRLGRNARKVYEERYTFSAFAERSHNVMKKVVANI